MSANASTETAPVPNCPDHEQLLLVFERVALEAGRCIMDIARDGYTAETKADQSVVTRADREAEAIILSALRSEFPQVPIVAEEETAAGASCGHAGGTFILVDPLDGTREFVRGGDDYTVNIALVEAGVPLVGVVYAPVRRMLYAGRPGRAEAVRTDADHGPLDRTEIGVRTAISPMTIVASRSHSTPETDHFVQRHAPNTLVSVGSSLKFCLLAAGEADLYPRFGRTMQWDTAAGDAVLRAAGGMTRTVDGEILRYGAGVTPDDEPFANAHFVAEGRLTRP